MEKEKRVYLVDCEGGRDDYNDDEFIKKAEEQGTVYSLEGFELAFNDEEISTEKWMRILTVK